MSSRTPNYDCLWDAAHALGYLSAIGLTTLGAYLAFQPLI